MKFRFLENIATADVAFEAYGKTMAELFESCGLALMETMVDTKTISKVKTQKSKLQLKSENLENLLYNFLSELVFLKDRDSLLFSKIKIKINLSSNIYHLSSNLWGEPINPSRHHLRADVKAITKHLFKIEKTLPAGRQERDLYKATVVLDI